MLTGLRRPMSWASVQDYFTRAPLEQMAQERKGEMGREKKIEGGKGREG
jgi:hypothetical protein